MNIPEARKLGYVRGAKVEIGNELRVMRSGRIKAENGMLIALESSPFVIYQFGHWCGKVLHRNANCLNRDTAKINLNAWDMKSIISHFKVSYSQFKRYLNHGRIKRTFRASEVPETH